MAMQNGILRAHIETFAGILNKDIDFTDNDEKEVHIVAIIADGGKGKSSIAGFLEACLSGKVPDDAMNALTGKAKGSLEFVRNGKKYTINFTKTKSSDTLRIKQPDGLEGGAKVLRDIVGPVAIDPFKLQKLKPDDQVIEIKKMLRLDTAEVDKKIAEATQEREAVGRDVKNLEGFLKMDSNNVIDLQQRLDEYKEEKKLEDREVKLTAAIQKNNVRTQQVERVNSLAREKVSKTAEVDTIRRQIEELQKQLELREQQVVYLDQEATKLTDWLQQEENKEQDIAALQAEIREINEFNAARRTLLNFLEKKKDVDLKRVEWNKLDDQVKALVANKHTAIKDIVKDLPGIDFKEPRHDEDGKVIDDRKGVYWHDRTLSMLSLTEMVTFGIQLKNLMDKKEGRAGLPVLILDDFESVGSQGQQEVLRLCKEEGYQAIVTYMDSNQSDLKVVIKHDLNFRNETKQSPAEKDAAAAQETLDQAPTQTENGVGQGENAAANS